MATIQKDILRQVMFSDSITEGEGEEEVVTEVYVIANIYYANNTYKITDEQGSDCSTIFKGPDTSAQIPTLKAALITEAVTFSNNELQKK